MQYESLSGKVALVTGASRGIGRAITLLFADKGATVYALARGMEGLQAVKKAGETFSGQIIPTPCDITNGQQVAEAVEQAFQQSGHIDFLINNAGLGHFAPVHLLDESDWDEMMNVNLKGTFLCTKYVVPHLLSQGKGHIINISSVAGLEGFAGGGGYCASKFGLMGFNDALTKELKPKGIKVSVICPGSVQTHFGGTDPQDYSLHPEDVAFMAYQMASAPERIILNQVIMRPKVPQK